jgi:hypothetical protein
MRINNVCKVASREARFMGCSIGLTISGCWVAAQLLGLFSRFLFRRVELSRRPRRRSISLMIAGSARICSTANSNLFSARGRVAESKRAARCYYEVPLLTLLLPKCCWPPTSACTNCCLGPATYRGSMAPWLSYLCAD